MAFVPTATGAMGCALFSGSCTGHGAGTGSSHHPGLGGGVLKGSPCPHAPLDPRVSPKPVNAMDATTIWPPHPQLPFSALVRNVIVNGIMPIIDFDLLITHPTPTSHTHTVVKPLPNGVCVHTTSSPAWHCTLGTAGGREAAPGHARKLLATSKTVWINGRRAGRFGDPFGDNTVAFPCNSRVAGCSPNVFIGA